MRNLTKVAEGCAELDYVVDEARGARPRSRPLRQPRRRRSQRSGRPERAECQENVYEVPEGLPEPVDDGACDHLPGMGPTPSWVRRRLRGPRTLTGTTVVYCYPLTGGLTRTCHQEGRHPRRPGHPQSCGFRDHHAELKNLGSRGLRPEYQDTAYQREAAEASPTVPVVER